jgi:uncharacterized protein YeaO (DUF488 family)
MKLSQGTELQMQAWLKDVAPGSDLRQWFGHPSKWGNFRQRYFRELLANPESDSFVLNPARAPVSLDFRLQPSP